MIYLLRTSVVSCILCALAFLSHAQNGGIREHPDLGDTSTFKKHDTTKPSRTKVYEMVDVDDLPEFPGGVDAYYKFLSKNLKWPKNEMGAQGRLLVGFIVERNGRLSNIKIKHSLDKTLDTEAIKALKKSPIWIPAKKNGEPVRMNYIVPVNFTFTIQ